MDVDDLVFAGDENDLPGDAKPVLNVITNADARFTALLSNQGIDMEIFTTLDDYETIGKILGDDTPKFTSKRKA